MFFVFLGIFGALGARAVGFSVVKTLHQDSLSEKAYSRPSMWVALQSVRDDFYRVLATACESMTLFCTLNAFRSRVTSCYLYRV